MEEPYKFIAVSIVTIVLIVMVVWAIAIYYRDLAEEPIEMYLSLWEKEKAMSSRLRTEVSEKDWKINELEKLVEDYKHVVGAHTGEDIKHLAHLAKIKHGEKEIKENLDIEDEYRE